MRLSEDLVRHNRKENLNRTKFILKKTKKKNTINDMDVL